MDPATNPALSVALALAIGVLAQSIAHHLRIPGIVLLLAAGAALGPEGIGWIQPAALGSALPALIGFAVAVILFEGGMNLNLARLRREALTIRRLVTLGAAITAIGGAVAARLVLGWDWRLSVLFGTLVIVTGPTVVGPLLRRLRINQKLATVLDAEGILIDPIGAIIAVVALEIVIAPSGNEPIVDGLALAGARLGGGLVFGVCGGLLLALLLRFENLIPDGLANVFTLSSVLAIYQVSEHILHESGIMTVTVAGLVVGNIGTRALRELLEFKEQLTVLLIGMLFVLLAADISLGDIRALGWRGVGTVLVLMLVVRPLGVLACTFGTSFTLRERALLCWIAPRGIVAAAVASVFAQTLDQQGLPGGSELRALVFLVIAMTVLLQGLSGGFVASQLGVRRTSHSGYAILGANPLALAVAELLRGGGEEVLIIDSNPHECRPAEERSFRVLYGNGLEERTLLRAGVDARYACIGLTGSSKVNFLFARRVHQETRAPHLYAAVSRGESGLTPEMVRQADCALLFGGPRDLELWTNRLRRDSARTERFERVDFGGTEQVDDAPLPDQALLPLTVERAGRVTPYHDQSRAMPGERVGFLVHSDAEAEAYAWLRQHGFKPAATDADADAVSLEPAAQPTD